MVPTPKNLLLLIRVRTPQHELRGGILSGPIRTGAGLAVMDGGIPVGMPSLSFPARAFCPLRIPFARQFGPAHRLLSLSDAGLPNSSGKAQRNCEERQRPRRPYARVPDHNRHGLANLGHLLDHRPSRLRRRKQSNANTCPAAGAGKATTLTICRA